MRQALRPTRAAPARGPRLPGKRPPSLHRMALGQTTRTPQRCPVVASIPRNLRGEDPQAPARNVATALPGPLRSARQTAKPDQYYEIYRPTSHSPSSGVSYLFLGAHHRLDGVICAASFLRLLEPKGSTSSGHD